MIESFVRNTIRVFSYTSSCNEAHLMPTKIPDKIL